MIITEDTTAEFPSEAGRPYIFSASGDFGGGAISLQWEDQGEWTTFPACHLLEDGIRVVTAPTGKLRFLTANTTAPAISAHVVPMELSQDNSADNAAPRLISVVDSTERLGLSSEQLRPGDIVSEIGSRQMTRITCVADANGSLNSTYFLIFDRTGQTYVWFDVAGQGTETGYGDRSLPVSIAQNASAAHVAAAVAAAILATGDYASAVAADGIVTVVNADFASRYEAFDDGGTGFSIETPHPGIDRGTLYFVIDPEEPGLESSWQGIPGIASDADTTSGGEILRAVTPASLHAWWSWIKSQVQGISGSWSWSGNQSWNGSSNDMPNQASLASSSSVVTRKLLTDEMIWSAPRFVNFDLATTAFASSANASGAILPGQVSLTLNSGAVSGNYSVGTLFRELACSEAGGGTPNFNVRFFLYFRISGGFPTNTTFRILAGVVSGKTGTLDDKGIGFRMTSDTTAVLMVHNGTTLTESSAFTVTNYGSHRNFLLENVGNGTVNLYYTGVAEGSRFSQTPSAVLTGGPTGSLGAASGKHCVVAQHVATGTTAQISNAHIVAARVYWP